MQIKKKINITMNSTLTEKLPECNCFLLQTLQTNSSVHELSKTMFHKAVMLPVSCFILSKTLIQNHVLYIILK